MPPIAPAAVKTSSVSSVKGEPICPKCKGKALKTLRPGDHDGATHYCISGCCDAGDNFYFTPSVVARLTPEAVTVFEKGQALLVDKGEKWEDEWKGMPEFKQEDLQPYKTIYVHFADRKDMEKFAKLVKQTITLNTRSVWYPEAEIGRIATKKYVKDEEVPF